MMMLLTAINQLITPFQYPYVAIFVQNRGFFITAGMKNQYNRESWLEATLKKIPSGSRILDAGAGERVYKKFCSHLTYVSQDFSQYDGEGDSAGLQMGSWDQTHLDIVSDITSVPQPDSSFDAIMCIEVFEHLPEPIQAIQEFSRLLRNDGYLIITAPFCSLTHFAPYHFYSGFNRYFFEKFLAENGFTIIEMTENGNYFEYIAQELRRIPSVTKKYCEEEYNFGLMDKISMYWVLRRLDQMSRVDRGSEEFLNFGYHILARKRIKLL